MKRHNPAVPLALTALLFFAPRTSMAAEIVPATAKWRYLPGISEASSPDHAAWRATAFDDTAWASGPAPFFFGKPFTGTELFDMAGRYSSLYLRHEFTADHPETIGALTFHVLSDDGFVLWLNGKEIARHNVPEGELPASGVASSAVADPIAYEDVVVPKPWELLAPGKNVLTVHAFNSSLQSPDFVLVASGEIERDTTAPTVVDHVPPPGSTVDELTQIEVSFSEPVTGVDAGDLLVNGTAATSVRQVAPDLFTFGFAQPPAGPVQFAWADGNGITDILGAPHPLSATGWTVKLDPAASRQNLAITEFMADNDKTLYDDDCDRPDWIEIWNSGSTDVNMQGWALTDDAADTGKWRFPAYTLTAGSRMVVFASAKNKTVLPTLIGTACKTKSNVLKAFHTNFKLGSKAGYLALAAPDGEVISEYKDYPAQTRDVSYGRIPGVEQPAFFAAPTPNAANTASGAGFAPDVTFSRPSGPIEQPFNLTLACEAANAVIRFTMDGSFPAETNKAMFTYSAPITISNIVQVRARAFAPGLLPSAPRSETYLMLTNSAVNMGSLTSSLPIVVLSTLKSASVTSTKNTTVHISLYEPVRGLTSLRNSPTMVSRGGIKTRGSSTGGQAQSNFAVDLWDEFDQDHNMEPFGMPADSEFVLYAPNGFDPVLIHNPFTMELSRQMGFYAPRTRFVEVYLDNGGVIASNDWKGVYVWMEKPGISKGRVDVPKAQPEDVLPPDVTGSYLFKTDRLDESGGDTGFSAGGATHGYVEPKESEMKTTQRKPQADYLKKFFADMDKALVTTNPNYRDPVLGYKAYLDVTNWVDFHLLETLSGQADAIRLSTYFYKRRNGKLEYGPRWDYDRAWESKDDSRDDNPRIWDSGGGLWGQSGSGSPNWYNNLFKDTDAWQVWIDRWQQFRKGPLSLTNMYAVINKMTNEVRWSQPREAKKYAETAPRVSYPNEVNIMKTWISNRVVWLDGQMAQPPTMSSKGGVVSPGFQLSLLPPSSNSGPANVTIFYTLDGTDPRPSKGTGTVSAFKYEGPITINANTKLIARARDTGRKQAGGPPSTTPWSSAVTATFVVTPPPLILTEIMFHPGVAAGSTESAGDYEFLELKNISDKELDLAGYHFTDGVEYQFTAASGVRVLAPGARVLVVRNQAAFMSRYPGVGNIAGEFAGALADEGEKIALAGPSGEPIFEVHYGDKWQALADGLGFSLVLRDESVAPADIRSEEAWRASGAAGGSPGAPDPLPQAPPRVLVSEVQPKSLGVPGVSQIELQNSEKTAADISGWWLTDDFKSPRKARLPADTKLAAGGFLVLPESVFNPAAASGFPLSLNGGAVWLFSADSDGNLTGWVHGFEFGPSEAGQSFGRIVNSVGEEQFPLQKAASLGSANSGPQPAAVAISEIMYQPPAVGASGSSDDEFIEITNLSDAATPLYDTAHPLNTWRIRGGAEFDIPANTSLAPHARLVVVGFDPLLNPVRLESLRRRMGWDAPAPVLGPWRGGLGNTDATVKLERPGIPVLTGGVENVPYFIVDQVRFASKYPWPVEAAGRGSSLLRRNLGEYGDDPANWLASPRLAQGTDLDDDGLPDTWEASYQLSALSSAGNDGPEGDPDGDGYTNRQEYLNGTNPKDPASWLRVSVGFGGGPYANLLLAAPAGQRFRIEARDSLLTGSWVAIGEVTTQANGVALLGSYPAQAGERYFRVVKP